MKAREHAERLFFPLVGQHPHQNLLPTRASARNATRWSSMEHEPYYGVSAGFRIHSLRTADATDAQRLGIVNMASGASKWAPPSFSILGGLINQKAARAGRKLIVQWWRHLRLPGRQRSRLGQFWDKLPYQVVRNRPVTCKQNHDISIRWVYYTIW